jgi:hypothetical protein
MFSILLLKWIGLVSLAAVIMTTLASLIFIGIFFIYTGIQVLCQCELAEGGFLHNKHKCAQSDIKRFGVIRGGWNRLRLSLRLMLGLSDST